MNKYLYLYNKENNLTHWKNAIKGADYKKYIDEDFIYTYKKGVERKYFTLKNNNPFAHLAEKNNGGGESVEHYNAKMKIATEKKYFDSIFNKTVFFHKVIPEKFVLLNKKPDLLCYDENDKLVCIIEILYSNRKTEQDIIKLEKNKVPIIEIDIKNENKCYHLILPTLLEINKPKFEELQRLDRKNKSENGISKVEREIENFKQRINNDKGNVDFFRQRKTEINSTIDFNRERIKEIGNTLRSKDKKLTTYLEGKDRKLRNSIEQLKREIKELDLQSEFTIKKIEKIAENSKIEWFRNSWIKFKCQNKIKEIMYWIS